MALTPKQQVFVAQYALDHNGAGAAVRAGYSVLGAKQTAHKLLTNLDVQEALRAEERALAAKLQVTRDSVVAALLEAVEMARLKGDAMALVAAWREIAKVTGLYAPENLRLELSARGTVTAAKLEGLSDGELVALAA